MKQFLTILAGVILGFTLAGILFLIIRLPAGKPIELKPAPTKAPIAVHVTGAVPRPGMYELGEGSRVQDAIDAAGGLLASADADSINLAAFLEDGQKLTIPYKAGQQPEQQSNSVFPTEQPGQSTGTGERININTASLEELDSLPGIGPTTAQNILDYRQENGPFQEIEDLLQVPGIGPSTYENIKDLITV